MIYASVCSGIEAASVAWRELDGWRPLFFSEIDAFPSAVLARRFPNVENRGDFTNIDGRNEGIELLVGGTPCQAFSVAGRRLGLVDPRGNLTLEFDRLVRRVMPRWVVWENVPGVLSIDGGRTFGAHLGALAQLGYGLAYRILDARFFGVPQRRRRVFVVGHLGAWQPAAAVLFESTCLRGGGAPRGEAGEAASAAPRRRAAGGGLGTDFDLDGGLVRESREVYGISGRGKYVNAPGTLRASVGDCGGGSENLVAHAVACHAAKGGDPTTDNYVVARALIDKETMHTLTASAARGVTETGEGRGVPIVPTAPSGVRRLTPRECERLQGFPDDWTLVPHRGKPAADAPRYRAIGNSMAVPVMRWIGERLDFVDRALIGINANVS